MFYECKSLKNIKELKYLDTKDINNFNHMFYVCKSLSEIKGLEKWNVSNGNDFNSKFYGCSYLIIMSFREYSLKISSIWYIPFF